MAEYCIRGLNARIPPSQTGTLTLSRGACRQVDQHWRLVTATRKTAR